MFTITLADLNRLYTVTKPFTAKASDNTPVLKNVRVRINRSEETLEFAATDRYALIQATKPVTLSGDENVDDFGPVTDLIEVSIAIDDLSVVALMCKQFDKKTHERASVRVAVTRSAFTFELPNGSSYAVPTDTTYNFPPIEKLIPEDTDFSTLDFKSPDFYDNSEARMAVKERVKPTYFAQWQLKRLATVADPYDPPKRQDPVKWYPGRKNMIRFEFADWAVGTILGIRVYN